ncbi:TIGR02206 family membrane protein [Metabacillus sp. 113a]|uniref:YwaF family protein n=1 Tax=Metabacillus sp. 113a TaxID=3404706 RepID=UPI003CF2F346
MSGSFQVFSLEHVLTLFIILIFSLLIFFLRTRFNLIRYSLGFLLFGSEAAEQIWKFAAGEWSVSEDLPLHLSDLAVLLSIIMLFTSSRLLFAFLWYAGLASSFQAIATPDLGTYSFPHLIFFLFFLSHGGVIIACLMFVFQGYKPGLQSLWITAAVITLYGAAVYGLNQLLGSNYLYLMKKPEGNSLLEFLGAWPWYLYNMEAVMLVSFFLLYLPFSKRSRPSVDFR